MAPGADAERGRRPRAADRRRLRELAARGRGARRREATPSSQAAVRARQGAGRATASTRSSSAASSPPPSTWPTQLRDGARQERRRSRRSPGALPPDEREARVAELARGRASGCSSPPTACREGINLQEHFDAVVHYDLAWNPTRHEQREGRVDRFGQPQPTVRVAHLLRRATTRSTASCSTCCCASTRRSATRSASPSRCPVDTERRASRRSSRACSSRERGDEQLSLLELDRARAERDELHDEWEHAAEREKRSRTVFAQDDDQGRRGRRASSTRSRAAIGSGATSSASSATRSRAHGRDARADGDPVAHRPRRGARARCATQLGLGDATTLRARFELPVARRRDLPRAHPSRSSRGWPRYVLDTALDPQLDGVGRSARGVIRTTRGRDAHDRCCCVRFRFDIVTGRRATTSTRMLAEECALARLRRAPRERRRGSAEAQAEALLDAAPDGNVAARAGAQLVARVVDGVDALRPAPRRGRARRGPQRSLDAHRRVREARRATRRRSYASSRSCRSTCSASTSSCPVPSCA